MSRIIYSIEGNIGSGKTTFLSLIKQSLPHICVIPEPVDEWRKIGSDDLLETYYSNPSRWAFTFQTYALMTRMAKLKKMLLPSNEGPYFCERSVLADRYIFARLLRRKGLMSELEHEVYVRMFDGLNELFHVPPIHRQIYLRTSPEMCLQRIQKRARHGESSISLHYLLSLHELHEEWLGSAGCLIINGERDFQHDPQVLNSMLEDIRRELN